MDIELWKVLPFQRNDAVDLQNLKCRELNGMSGLIEDYNEEKNRFQVRLHNGEQILVPAINLYRCRVLLYSEDDPKEKQLGDSVRRQMNEMNHLWVANFPLFAKRVPRYIRAFKIFDMLPQCPRNKHYELDCRMQLARFLSQKPHFRKESDNLYQQVLMDPSIHNFPRIEIEAMLHKYTTNQYKNFQKALKAFRPYLREHHGMVCQIGIVMIQCHSELKQYTLLRKVHDYVLEEIRLGHCDNEFRCHFLSNYALRLCEQYMSRNGHGIPGTDEESVKILGEMKVALKAAQKNIKEQGKDEDSIPYQFMMIAKGITQMCSLRPDDAIETMRAVNDLINQKHGPESEMLRKYVLPTELSLFIMMGDKKKAERALKRWKRFGMEATGRMKKAELLVRKMKQTNNVELKKTLKRCSNLECGKVESKAGEFKACGTCGIARYCGRECQKHDWKMGHKKLCRKSQINN